MNNLLIVNCDTYDLSCLLSRGVMLAPECRMIVKCHNNRQLQSVVKKVAEVVCHASYIIIYDMTELSFY